MDVQTLKAASKVGEGITCKIETGKMLAEDGLHPATAIDFDLKDASIHVEGDLDFRGTLSVDKNAPVGFRDIRLNFQVISDEPAEKLATLIKLTERFCVVFQTLAKGNSIAVSYT